jgi:hypothetical protein
MIQWPKQLFIQTQVSSREPADSKLTCGFAEAWFKDNSLILILQDQNHSL